MDNVKNTSFTEEDLADIQAQLDEIDDEIESRPKTIEEMQRAMHSMIAELQAKNPDNSQSDTNTPQETVMNPRQAGHEAVLFYEIDTGKYLPRETALKIVDVLSGSYINGQPSESKGIDPDLVAAVKGYMPKQYVSPSNGRK